jgi:hypothetical protein
MDKSENSIQITTGNVLDINLEELLKNKIQDLKMQIANFEHQLFTFRLYKLLGLTEKEMTEKGVTNIVINTTDSEFLISYTHHTDMYDENNYVNDNDSHIETEIYKKTSCIELGKTNVLGKNSKYYIKGNKSARFKIYRKTKNILSIINKDYDTELDIDEQTELIEKYSKNSNIPEWLALKVFLYIRENEWNDDNICNYFGVI